MGGWAGGYFVGTANELLAQLTLVREVGLVTLDAVDVVVPQDVALAVQRLLAVAALVRGLGHPGWESGWEGPIKLARGAGEGQVKLAGGPNEGPVKLANNETHTHAY